MDETSRFDVLAPTVVRPPAGLAIPPPPPDVRRCSGHGQAGERRRHTGLSERRGRAEQGREGEVGWVWL